MPQDRPLSPDAIARYADPAYLSRSAPQEPTEDGRRLFRTVGLPVLLGGNGADLLTTLKALSDGRGAEANPIMGSSPGRIAATKAAATAGEAFLLDHLAKNHKLAALLTALGVGGAGFALAAHNAKVGK